MNEIIYLDVYFVINFLMDGLSLLTAGIIASEKLKPYRLVLASVFGGVTSSLLLLLPWGKGGSFFLGFASFLPMILIAFGRKSPRRLFFVSLFAFLTSLFLGGVLEWLTYYTEKRGITLGLFIACVLFAMGGFTLWGGRMHRRLKTSVISLSILHRGKEEQLYGLVDSGSLLREPESGKDVILLKAEYAFDLLSPMELICLRQGQGEGVIPVPLKTASGQGCLFAFCPQEVRFHFPKQNRGRKKEKREKKEVLIALDFTGGGFAGCPCLIPLSLVS